MFMKVRLAARAAAALCLLALSWSVCLRAEANSAQTSWSGTDSSGLAVSDGECPVVVRSETLTFCAEQFPLSYYDSEEAFASYSGKVTAEYALYNPSDYTVSATLLFPFGTEPTYAPYQDDGAPYDDTSRYDVTADGAPVQTRIRYTLMRYGEDFDLDSDLQLLTSGYYDDGFFRPGMTVTEYVYRPALTDKSSSSASVAFDAPANMSDCAVFFPQRSGFRTQLDGDLRLSAWAGDEEYVIYSFGQPLPFEPEWRFYADGGVRDGDEIDGSMSLAQTRTLDFKTFALSLRPEDSQVSDMDWFNAVAVNLCRDMTGGVCLAESFDPAHELMRWYEYDITVAPRSSIVNTVSAPLYPSIDSSYDPSVYGYTYLLSPARTWADFGSLRVIVDTPYFITDSSLQGFTRTENGYEAVFDGLPQGELEFSLCASESPQRGIFGDFYPFGLIILLYMLVALAVVAVVIVLVRRFKRRAKNR